jgi:plastocyanin
MNRYRPTALLAILASLVILLAACGAESAAQSEAAADESTAAVEPDAPSEEAAADGAEVRIVNAVFEPTELTVSVGTEVVFTNEDSYAHTVSEGTVGTVVDDPIVDEEIAAGGEVRVTFDEAGTFDITCVIHPDMQMTITVEG